MKSFAAKQPIYETGDPGKAAYVLISGSVTVTTVDQESERADHQSSYKCVKLLAYADRDRY